MFFWVPGVCLQSQNRPRSQWGGDNEKPGHWRNLSCSSECSVQTWNTGECTLTFWFTCCWLQGRSFLGNKHLSTQLRVPQGGAAEEQLQLLVNPRQWHKRVTRHCVWLDSPGQGNTLNFLSHCWEAARLQLCTLLLFIDGLGSGPFSFPLSSLFICYSAAIPCPGCPAQVRGSREGLCSLTAICRCDWDANGDSVANLYIPFGKINAFTQMCLWKRELQERRGGNPSERNIWKYFLYFFLPLLNWIGLVRGVGKG